MVALKGFDIDKFLARPHRPIVLVFGPDAGLARERAEALVRMSVDDPKDPFQLARLDGDDLAGEPTRLVEEANTIPLFGGRRAVWVKAGARNFAPAVEALVAAPAPASITNATRRCGSSASAPGMPSRFLATSTRKRIWFASSMTRCAMRALSSHRRRALPSFRCSAATGSRPATKFASSRCSRAERRAWSSKMSWRRSPTPRRSPSTA